MSNRDLKHRTQEQVTDDVASVFGSGADYAEYNIIKLAVKVAYAEGALCALLAIGKKAAPSVVARDIEQVVATTRKTLAEFRKRSTAKD